MHTVVTMHWISKSIAMPVKRKRPEIVALQLTAQEKQELQRAADQAVLPLSAFIRALALTAVRRGDLVISAAARTA
jgi:hypothetical protein